MKKEMNKETNREIGTKTTKMEVETETDLPCLTASLPPSYTERERFLMSIERERCEEVYRGERAYLRAGYLVVSVMFIVVGGRYYTKHYLMPAEYKRLARLENQLILHERELAKAKGEVASAKKAVDTRLKRLRDYPGGDPVAYLFGEGRVSTPESKEAAHRWLQQQIERMEREKKEE